jgi:hypothetical protein
LSGDAEDFAIDQDLGDDGQENIHKLQPDDVLDFPTGHRSRKLSRRDRACGAVTPAVQLRLHRLALRLADDELDER